MSANSIAFDRAADFYDETRSFPPGVEQPAAATIARAGQLTPESRVLEIGIGTGRIGLLVSAYSGAYYGIDLSIPMMQRLRTKQNGEAVFVAQGDATRLPFPDRLFDAAVSVHIWHLIPNWQQALNETARVLRPGAAVAVLEQ